MFVESDHERHDSTGSNSGDHERRGKAMFVNFASGLLSTLQKLLCLVTTLLIHRVFVS